MKELSKEEHIKRYRSGNISKAKYCHENGLAYGSCKNWLRKREIEDVSNWQSVSIQEEDSISKNRQNYFELRIFGDWKIEINMRLSNDI